MLEKDPDIPGSLGIAISEAVEDAATHSNTNYALGSVLNHVCLHQTVIGLESREQLAMVDAYPDVVIGCVGGGSNFAGISFPFAGDKLTGKHKDVDIVAVEPASCPTFTKGLYTYDFGDVAGLTPLLKMFTLGHDFVPPSTRAACGITGIRRLFRSLSMKVRCGRLPITRTKSSRQRRRLPGPRGSSLHRRPPTR